MSLKKETEVIQQECSNALLPVRDALDVLNGTWKLPILIVLYSGSKRFSEISKELNGITDKMLSKELKDLEVNQLIVRKVYATFPQRVEYTTTPYTLSLLPVISSLKTWGIQHRAKIIGR